MIDFLGDSGLDFNLPLFNFDNFTPLMLASLERKLLSVSTLIEWGANVNLQTSEGITALMLTVKFRNLIEAQRIMKREYPKYQEKLVNLLYKAGANLNAQDTQGKTALIYAVEYGPYQIVDLLIKLGANCYTQDVQGMTAMDYARSRKTLLNFEQKHAMRIIDILQSSKI
ncbi:MAG: ankyrin repeat domain-containing protein [Jaaginema sp. PMC 1079.18]|nr:ankyrin repeat domain-containing protein [Jaaginema sp. PMC 1080.18]MEC4853423.1 ankyrin repeat domain-containing protein [Jaaginema sp. PMC 1079.18]MEC4869142.1 ankyrin repeat domain-containing protein [Jaaginema sp. PMC 1078.18]